MLKVHTTTNDFQFLSSSSFVATAGVSENQKCVLAGARVGWWWGGVVGGGWGNTGPGPGQADGARIGRGGPARSCAACIVLQTADGSGLCVVFVPHRNVCLWDTMLPPNKARIKGGRQGDNERRVCEANRLAAHTAPCLSPWGR